jgi:hypothetical protein
LEAERRKAKALMELQKTTLNLLKKQNKKSLTPPFFVLVLGELAFFGPTFVPFYVSVRSMAE